MSSKVSSQEYFSVSAVVYVAQFFTETILGDHLAGDIGGLLDVSGSSDGDIVQFKFLSHTAAHGGDDVVVHFLPGLEHVVILRKIHGISACASSGHDGDFVNVHVLGKASGNHSMTCLVVCGEFLLFV